MSIATNIVLEPLRYVIEDIVAWAPELAVTLQRDLHRVAHLCETRGVEQILFLHFPAAGKHLDNSLSKGYLLLQGDFPASLGSRKRADVVFQDLYDMIFEPISMGGNLLLEPDHDAIFFLRQVLYLYKKVEYPCPELATQQAREEYVVLDRSLRSPTLNWAGEGQDFATTILANRDKKVSFTDLILEDSFEWPVCSTSKALQVLQQVADTLGNMVPRFSSEEVIPRHGPGAVADAKTGTDKYQFPTWSPRLEYSFPHSFFAEATEELAFFNPNQPKFEYVPARLSAVPKTYKGPRLITIEPTANQFLQQGLMRWFRKTLPEPLRRSIDFRSQEASRNLVLSSSMSKELATVDLTSASDLLSCWTVERMFRNYGDILPALHATRSHTISVPDQHGGEFVLSLNKFAGMGSAVTFPVQSIAYAMCCYAAVLVSENRKPTYNHIMWAAKSVRVYGDDIIIPTTALPFLAAILSGLQLKVNWGKTHYSGHFRESCGLDAYDGSDVTPVYVTAWALGNSPKALASWIDVSNNAYKSGLWSLASWMVGLIPTKYSRQIPIHKVPMGMLTLLSFSTSLLPKKSRFNKDLQIREWRALTIVSKVGDERREDSLNLLQYFLEYNPNDWVNCPITERHFDVPFVGVRGVPRLKLESGWVRT